MTNGYDYILYIELFYVCNRGLSKQSLGDKAGAIFDFKKALSLQPNNGVAKKNLLSVNN